MLVDKPAGPTSHDIVAEARSRLGTRRVGHAGTLDPFATGLLLLCVGRATRLVEYLHRLTKTYEAVARLGMETRSHDPEGEITSTSEAWRELSRADVERAMDGFRGPQRQRPPAFSAKRVGQRRAHEAAREGETVRLEPVEVTVHALELLAFEPPELRFRAEVSTGTYVRALARDLGRALGCGASLTCLRRTAVGPFAASDAVAPAEIGGPGADRAWRTAAEALAWLPGRRLGEEEAGRVRSGARIPRGKVRAGDPRWSRPTDDGQAPVALTRDGRLVAVAEALDEVLQPRKVLDI